LEDGSSKDFSSSPGETFSVFQRRALDKLQNLVDIEISQLHITVTDADGIEKNVSDVELMSKLLIDQTLTFKVKRKKSSTPVDKALERLRDKSQGKYTFSGFQAAQVPVEFNDLVSVAYSIDLSNNSISSLPSYFDAFSELKVRNITPFLLSFVNFSALSSSICLRIPLPKSPLYSGN